MSLRFLTDGTVVVDTVVEALAFERGRTTSTPKPKHTTKHRRKPKIKLDAELEGTWEGFYQLIEARKAVRMRKLLALVKGRHPSTIDLHELQQLMGDPHLMTTNGSVSGITRNAVKAGLDPADIVIRGPGTQLRAGVLLQEHDPPDP